MAKDKSDFDFSDQTAVDPMIKAPGNEHGVESMKDRQEADEELQRADLDDKAAHGATEIDFQSGQLEPVAEHVGPEVGDDMDGDEPARMTPASGEADGPHRPHVGTEHQSAVDAPDAVEVSKPRARRRKG